MDNNIEEKVFNVKITKFWNLYKKWKESYVISAHGPSDPIAQEPYEKLKEWVKNNQ